MIAAYVRHVLTVDPSVRRLFIRILANRMNLALCAWLVVKTFGKSDGKLLVFAGLIDAIAPRITC